MDWLKNILDDKGLVIVCATVIAIVAMYQLPPDAGKLIAATVVGGICGIAIGRKLNE